MITVDPQSLILAILTAIASGIVGSFALMKRMTLAGDAFAHIALPGIGIALLYSVNPVLGGATALLLGAFIVWRIENTSRLETDAVIGVIFAISLAVGAFLIKEEHELIETLFGGISPVSFGEFMTGSVAALLIITFMLRNRRALTLGLVSKELAMTTGISVKRLQLFFLFSFALTVILGMKFLGVLLMGSLIIIPAAAARNIARNLTEMLVTSSLAAVLSVAIGIPVSELAKTPPGATIIIVAGIIFTATLAYHLIRDRNTAKARE